MAIPRQLGAIPWTRLWFRMPNSNRVRRAHALGVTWTHPIVVSRCLDPIRSYREMTSPFRNMRLHLYDPRGARAIWWRPTAVFHRPSMPQTSMVVKSVPRIKAEIFIFLLVWIESSYCCVDALILLVMQVGISDISLSTSPWHMGFYFVLWDLVLKGLLTRSNRMRDPFAIMYDRSHK